MTSYPGRPTPGEATNVAFYITHQAEESPYGQSISVRVLRTTTFGDSPVVLDPMVIAPFDNLHKLSVTFPQDGEYIVELTMEVEGQVEVIPFLMVAGNPTATVSILVTLGLLLGLFVIVMRAIRIKRARRLHPAG